jgi:hypothetical protein
MSYTLFNSTTAATGLIAQPGRAVNTFPSGLVRVDQTYLGLTANATAHRATLAVGNNMPDGDTSPCIDGLKIFPEVQERRREDGWTEYIVSAFGRTAAPGKSFKGINLQNIKIAVKFAYSNLPPGFSSPPGAVLVDAMVASDTLTKSFVVTSTTNANSIALPTNVTLSANIQSSTLNSIQQSLQSTYSGASVTLPNLSQNLSTQVIITNVTRTPYGYFDELTIVWGLEVTPTSSAIVQIAL